MFYQTWTFALFFAAFYAAYLAVRKTPLRVPWLLAASYVFYGWLSPVFVVYLMLTTVVDYMAVLGMSKFRHRWPWLAVSLAFNLGMLAMFKYMPPAAEWVHGALAAWINAGLGLVGLRYSVPLPATLLPIGMSFFIFQSLTYTVGYYRGGVEPARSLLDYAAFVAMFPQLLSGPIERAKTLLPEIGRVPEIAREDVADGLSLFLVGLFKKAVLADCLGMYVDRVYGPSGVAASSALLAATAPALLLATFAYAWQIYFDFSGYTDMARGVARTMGYRLMLNFDNPYLADGLGDFWRRWHISLSTWFRDYVYIPLGGNRHGPARTYLNMFLTMLLSGLWHGATWNFAAWGALHGLGRVLTRWMEENPFYRQQVPRAVKTLWVFLFASFAWIFFRAATLADAWLVVRRIAAWSWTDPACPLLLAGLVLAVWLYQAIYESRFRAVLELAPVRIALAVLLAIGVAVLAPSGVHPFIYSQF